MVYNKDELKKKGSLIPIIQRGVDLNSNLDPFLKKNLI